MNGNGVNIQGSRIEQFLPRKANDFAGNVIQVGFEQRDLIALAGNARRADEQPQHIGPRGKILGPRAVANAFDGHLGKGTKAVGQGGGNGGPCGGRQFRVDGNIHQRNAFEEFARRGGGNAAPAMRDFNEALPRRNWRSAGACDAQQVPSDCCADDVGDGIDRPHFVKVNLLDRHAVDLGFRVAKPHKDPLR